MGIPAQRMADEEKKNRPDDSDFKQQRLRAWQPILTPGWVIFTFATVGVLFLAIGIAVLMASNDVVELESDAYQSVKPDSPHTCIQGAGSTSTSCLVDVTVKVTADMTQPIYMYYQLKNFYQNHRRYVKSRSDPQLRNDGTYDVTGYCEPLATRSCNNSAGSGTCAVYPCGLIAWSVFNDTFYNMESDTSSMTVTRDGRLQNISWTSQNIAWDSDVEKKFKVTSDVTPVGKIGNVPTESTAIALPYDSYKYFLCADTTFNTTAGNLADCPQDMKYADVSNEEFIVWMRTSGLPDFRKLHRIINKDLKSGDEITLKINNVFPVEAFDGEKKVVFSTTTWIGGKNNFLGWAYIVVAILCLLLAIAFGVKQAVNPRDMASSPDMDGALSENQ